VNRRKLLETGIITGLVISLFSEKSWASEEEGDEYCKTKKNDEGNQDEEDSQEEEDSQDNQDEEDSQEEEDSQDNEEEEDDDSGEEDDSREDDDKKKKKKTCPVIKKIKPKEWKADKCLTVTHIKNQFGEKFPLKMVTFEAPDAGDPDCMVIEIGSRKIPACSVNTVLKILKWPLYLRYIIWSVMEL
jgi:hypothetical protein